MEWFVENYVSGKGKKVLDVGSMDITSVYKKLFDRKGVEYIGLDICPGSNVDIVMDDPYIWNSLQDDSFDYVISGQAFEHIEYPWLTIKEIYKKIKPGGLCCIIAPNTSGEHRVPKDCYRYFSDGFAGLAKWAGFTVIDVSVAGIPRKDVSPEWDSYDNDVCLIAKKTKEGDVNSNYPKLKYERRISGQLDERLRYKFLLKWSGMENRQEFLVQFMKEKNVETVYVYGYGNIGKLVCKELENIENVKIEIIDQHVIKTEKGKVCKREGDILTEKHSIMIITVLDSNRHLKLYLDSIYPNIPKYYIDELIEGVYLHDYFEKHEKVYIYGAGDYGIRVLNFLAKCSLRPSGVIVSKGHKRAASLQGYAIKELNEIPQEENTGIIIAVGFAIEKEIEYILLERGYDYIMCDVVGIYSVPGRSLENE